MEFDPVGSAESIPHMIKNDTLLEVLDRDQLSDCLKHITLNVDNSLYILDRVQSKYKVPDRFKAIRHIFTDFGENKDFDPKIFVEFTRALGRCLHLEILDSMANIMESTFNSDKKPENYYEEKYKQLLQETNNKINELQSQFEQYKIKMETQLSLKNDLICKPQDSCTLHEQRANLDTDSIEQYKENIKILQERINLYEEAINTHEETNKVKDERIKTYEESTKVYEERIKTYEEQNRICNELIRVLKERIRVYEENNN